MKQSSSFLNILALALVVLASGLLSSCKKDHSSVTRSGGGASTQSVVTIKGAAQ